MKPLAISIGRIIALFVVVSLTSCGGSGGGGDSSGGTTPPVSSITLSGVAAVGTPIVNGNVRVICTTGGTNTPTTTNNSGAWSITLTGQSTPCAVEVSGGTINGVTNTTPYHSIAINAGTVNVTPLTDLIVANLVSAATPSAWFANLSASAAPLAAITQNKVTTAFFNLSTALSGLTALSNFNPMTTSFSPTSGNVSDDMLTALANAMASNSTTYNTLLSNASSSTFTAPTGFNAALAIAYAGTTSGSIPFTIGGSVTGLSGSGLVLQNNGVNNLSISANGSFSFSTSLTTGSTYGIAVLTQPTGQSCSIANRTGTVNNANISNIAVICTNVTLSCVGGSGGGTNGIRLYNPSNYFSVALSTTSANALDSVTAGWGAAYSGATGTYTGSLAATVWAVTSSYSGGTVAGTFLGNFVPNFIGSGAHSSSQIAGGGYSINTIVSSASQINPPAGQYCLVLTLEEYAPGQCVAAPNSNLTGLTGYCVVDWLQFNNTVIFQ